MTMRPSSPSASASALSVWKLSSFFLPKKTIATPPSPNVGSSAPSGVRRAR
jgi:hypothetical protein